MSVRGIRLPLGDERVQRSLRRLLGANVLCSIATGRPHGIVHINTAYYAYSPALEFFFLSYPHAVHSRNLATNSSMAMAIFDSRQVWGEPDCGVQLFGTGRVTAKRAAEKAERVYRRRFRSYARWKRAQKRADSTLALRFYRFMPDSLKLLDERTFGGGVFVNVTVAGDDRSLSSPAGLIPSSSSRTSSRSKRHGLARRVGSALRSTRRSRQGD